MAAISSCTLSPRKVEVNAFPKIGLDPGRLDARSCYGDARYEASGSIRLVVAGRLDEHAAHRPHRHLATGRPRARERRFPRWLQRLGKRGNLQSGGGDVVAGRV